VVKLLHSPVCIAKTSNLRWRGFCRLDFLVDLMCNIKALKETPGTDTNKEIYSTGFIISWSTTRFDGRGIVSITLVLWDRCDSWHSATGVVFICTNYYQSQMLSFLWYSVYDL